MCLVCWRHGSQPMIFTVQRMLPPPHRARPLCFFCLGCLVYDAPRDAFARTHPISAIIDRTGQTVSHSARRSRGRISVYCTIRNKQDLSLVYEGGKRAGGSFQCLSLATQVVRESARVVSCGYGLVECTPSLLPGVWCVLNVDPSPLLAVGPLQAPPPDV